MKYSGFVRTKNYIMSEIFTYMKVEDYADKYGISVKTVYNQIKSGKISKERVKKVLNITLIRV